MSKKRVIAGFASVTVFAAGFAVAPTVASAGGAKKYSSCEKLQKKYKNGVAKNKKAAKRAVKAGHYKPASGKKARKVYKANYKSLDRDRDKVACER